MVVWLGDFNVSRNTSRVPHPYTEEDAEMFIAGIQRKGRHYTFSILRKSDGMFLGGAGLQEMEKVRAWLLAGNPILGPGLCHRSGPPPDDVRLRGSGSADHPCRLVLRQSGFSGHVLAKLGARHNGSQMRDCRARGMKILCHDMLLTRADFLRKQAA